MPNALKRPASAASDLAVQAPERTCVSSLLGAKLVTTAVEAVVRGISEKVRAAISAWPENLGSEGRRQLLTIHREFSESIMTAFSWGGPVDTETIQAIRTYCPSGVVEIGGGLGHWARALSDAGIPVACFDKSPGAWSRFNHAFKGHGIDDGYTGQAPFFFPVEVGGVEKVAQYPGRGLLLVWPPAEAGEGEDCPSGHGSTMAFDSLETLPPTVIFVGRRAGALDMPDRQTAGPKFFGLLRQHYAHLREVRCRVPDSVKWLARDSKPEFESLSTVSIWRLKSTAARMKADDISVSEIGFDVKPGRRTIEEDVDDDAEKARARLCRISAMTTICELEDLLLRRCQIEELFGRRSKARQLSGTLLRKLWKMLGLPVIPLPGFADEAQRRQHLHRHLSALFEEATSQKTPKKSRARGPRSTKTVGAKTDGADKGKRGRPGKKDGTPKKAASAYQVFNGEVRAKISKELGEMDGRNSRVVATKVAEAWKALTDAQKKPFHDKADKLKAEYKKGNGRAQEERRRGCTERRKLGGRLGRVGALGGRGAGDRRRRFAVV